MPGSRERLLQSLTTTELCLVALERVAEYVQLAQEPPREGGISGESPRPGGLNLPA